MKYIGEQGDHGGDLGWPGLYGLPMRGNGGSAGLLKDEELDEFFEVVYDFKCREFDLSDPEQLKQYTEVMDRIVNQWYVQRFCDNYRHPETGARRVYLEWVQQYGQINPKAASRVDPSGSSIQRVG